MQRNPPISPETSPACPSWTAHNVNKSVLDQTVLLMGSANKHGPYLHQHTALITYRGQSWDCASNKQPEMGHVSD